MKTPRRPLVIQLCAVDFTMRQFIAPLALALARDGYEVKCACTHGPHWEQLRAMGLDMVEMPVSRSANPMRAAGSVWRLYRYLRRMRPDVLHVHTPVASMIGRLAAWMARVPVTVYTAHGFYFHDRMAPRRRYIHLYTEKLFERITDFLFCVSREDAALAVARRFLPREAILHTPNGADAELFDPARFDRSARGEFGIPDNATVVAIVGRLVREKGYEEFLAAAESLSIEFPRAHFLAIGGEVVGEHDGLGLEWSERIASGPLAGRVHFTGLRDDVARLLAASDIFCLPSHREGMPVSIIEAMLMSLPTVTTRIRGCRELIREDGRFGFLVEPGDAEALREALAWLLGHPDEARQMGGRARRHALKAHREDCAVARVVRIYNDMIRRRLK